MEGNSGLPPSVRAQVAAAKTRNDYVRVDSLAGLALRWRVRSSRTLWGRAPLICMASVSFHVLVMGIPLVNTAHAILLDTYWSVSPPSLSEAAVERLMTLLLVLMAGYWVRRLVVARVRAISTWRDHLALALTAAPFVTGYLAHHQLWIPHEWMVCLHIASAETLLALIPFTKLAHMPFFVFSRFLTRGEMGFRPGIRQWPDFS